MKDIAMNRSKRPGTRWVLGSAAACLAWLASGTASAVPITYTLTWNGVSGTYGETSITNQTLVLTFSGDTDDVQNPSTAPSIDFTNGAGMTITLGGTTLSNAALDDDARNSSRLAFNPTATAVFFQGINVSTQDRGFLTWPTAPVDPDQSLTTDWTASAPTARLSQGWSSGGCTFGNCKPLVIDGIELYMTANTGTDGQWNSASGPSLPSTTTTINTVNPSPVVEGNSYTVSGTVAVDESESAPSEGNLPGSVMVDGDGAGCEDSDLVPSSAGT
ncbi:MAG: hypothetical protein ACO200_12280, partial [Steroidobacteraceae bacterium]